ncbi:MAG: B12-binding domain-containing radical SAM protein [Planctomycetes bacterium]|nr:B12-binding domain-containing radical SAM protein [Planctomycetota bacterium]
MTKGLSASEAGAGGAGKSKFRHVLCINPYYEEISGAMGFFPPTGLEYIASAFATVAPRVTIADLRHDGDFRPESKLAEFIKREGVDLLAVSVNWGFGLDEALGLVSRLPAGICTIVGGQEATAKVEEIMRRCPNVDYVARGEGEEIAIELASGRPVREITGLSRRENGSIIHNENRTVGKIGILPERDRSLRRVRYGLSRYGVEMLSGGIDTVLSSRGCPFQCEFCSFNRNPLGKKRDYEERPAECVFEEVQSLDSDIIFFVDDNFSVNEKRVERLCDLIIESGLKKRFLAQARVEIARNPRLLEKLVRAGFKALFIGVESAEDRILKQLKKGFTTAQLREYFKVFRQFDIFYSGYFMYGNIGETEEEMLEIPGFAHELGLDSITYMKLRAYELAPIKDVVEATPGYHIASDGVVYSDRYSTADLARIGKQIKKRFYTPMHVARTVSKILRIGMVRWRDIAMLPFRLPVGLYNWRAGKRKRAKQRRLHQTGATGQ